MAVRAANNLLERVKNTSFRGKVGKVGYRFLRLQSLEQRTAIILEDIRHLAGREPGLDDVVAFGAARALLDVEADVRMLFRIGL